MKRHSILCVVAAVAVGAACAQSGAGDGAEGGNAGEDDGGPSSTGATGDGGDPATTGGGAGDGNGGAGGAGVGGSGSGGDVSTGSTGSTTSGGMNSCLHDVCTEGPALTFGCGEPCVDTVCNADPYCCDSIGGEWDSVCVDEAIDLCGSVCMVNPGPISPGDIVITEIMNNPAQVTDSLGEWFEVYNDAPYAVDLQGLQIAHQANDPNAIETINASLVLQPGDYAVLGINANTSTNGNVTVDYQYSVAVSLNNTADQLAILDASNVVIDQVNYDEASGLDPNGATRTLSPLHLNAVDNDTDAHFCAASSTMVGGTDLGTPGASNDACP